MAPHQAKNGVPLRSSGNARAKLGGGKDDARSTALHGYSSWLKLAIHGFTFSFPTFLFPHI